MSASIWSARLCSPAMVSRVRRKRLASPPATSSPSSASGVVPHRRAMASSCRSRCAASSRSPTASCSRAVTQSSTRQNQSRDWTHSPCAFFFPGTRALVTIQWAHPLLLRRRTRYDLRLPCRARSGCERSSVRDILYPPAASRTRGCRARQGFLWRGARDKKSFSLSSIGASVVHYQQVGHDLTGASSGYGKDQGADTGHGYLFWARPASPTRCRGGTQPRQPIGARARGGRSAARAVRGRPRRRAAGRGGGRGDGGRLKVHGGAAVARNATAGVWAPAAAPEGRNEYGVQHSV